MKETDSLGIIKRVQADEELRSAWEKLSEPAREMFREIDQTKHILILCGGKRVGYQYTFSAADF